MFDIFLDGLKKLIHSRLLPLAAVFVVMFVLLVNQIFNLQIVEGSKNAGTIEAQTKKDREIKSTRGNIYDRNGVLLAYNELANTVTLEDTGELKTNEEKNSMISKLIKLIERYGGTLATEYYIVLDEKGDFVFNGEENTTLRFKRDIYFKSSVSQLSEDQRNATAEEVYYYLKNGTKNNSMFGISDEYSLEESLKIISVRYSLLAASYTKYIPIPIANNVDDKTVAAVKENSGSMPGIDILQETNRVYNDSKYFSHIIGYTGLITQEAMEKFKEEGVADNYSVTDQIGKDGIEKVYEKELHGTKGNEEVLLNLNRTVLEILDREEAVAGNDIYLTIDSKLQKKYYSLIEKRLAGILLTKIHPGTDNGVEQGRDKITITIFDVYFALIDNNIIDIKAFTNDDATDLEKSVHKKFLTKQKDVFKQLDTLLAVKSKTSNSDTSKEMEEYLNYIYSLLIKENILLKQKIDTQDETYVNYANGKISLSEFLQYAIAKQWIDDSVLEIEGFSVVDEIYVVLVDYIKNILENDGIFNKKLYNYLVYSYKLSGTEICLLLFDQGVLKYNESDISDLKNGHISAYNFMTKKIKNLEITPAQLALEPCSGSLVVTDVNSGEVLALVSYPAYDNNKLANTMDSAYWNQLQVDKSLPMFNRTTSQKTAPGSTFKMVSAVAGLEEGVITPTEKIKDLGIFDKIVPSPRCHIYPRTHGSVDVAHAIEVSCNYYFYEMAYRLSTDSKGVFNNNRGLEKIGEYAEMFGLSGESGVELTEYTPQISDQDSVRSAIGQGTNNYTPVQIAKYITSIANRGKNYDLTIIDKIMSVDGEVVLENKAKANKKIEAKSSTWEAVQNGMNLVVNGSNSSINRLFKDLNVTVAGKTGTAQESTTKPNHALFVSYAPYEKPEISVISVIPNGYTSANAAELARDVYKHYYKSADDKEESEEVSTPEIAGGITD